MNKLIIIGAGGHAKACIDVIEKEKKYKVFGIVDKNKLSNKKFMGYPIIGSDVNLKKIKTRCSNAFIAIGQIKNPKIRANYFNKLKSIGFNLPIVTSPYSYVSHNSKVGFGTIIMHKAIISAASKVGSNCIINTSALLEHDVEVGNNTHVSTGVIINGNSKVGNNTFIGSGSVIKEGVIIGNNCIIGMGKLIKKDIKNLQIIK